MNKFKATALILSAALLASCAKSSKNIESNYVPTTTYSGKSCGQLELEYNTIKVDYARIAKKQDDRVVQDAVTTGVGLVLFAPAFFLLLSDDDKEKVAVMKGHYKAIVEAAKAKNCPFADGVSVVG